MPTLTKQPIRLTLTGGRTLDVAPHWRGIALAVHKPVTRGGDSIDASARGQWVITAHTCGHSAGTYRGRLADAIALARAWDQAFADGLAAGNGNLSAWPHSQTWARQLRRELPPTGPITLANGEPIAPRPAACCADGDGSEQFPAAVTLCRGDKPGTVRYSRTVCGRPRLQTEDGRGVRTRGDVGAFKGPDPLTPRLRLWFGGAWHDVPTLAEVGEWTLDSVCPTPTGETVEPDHPDSWLCLLGLV